MGFYVDYCCFLRVNRSLLLKSSPILTKDLCQDIPEDERYWLMHKNGYTLARLLETTNDGRMKVAVCGMEMMVDVTDVDKANPVSSDRAEDLSGWDILRKALVL